MCLQDVSLTAKAKTLALCLGQHLQVRYLPSILACADGEGTKSVQMTSPASFFSSSFWYSFAVVYYTGTTACLALDEEPEVTWCGL